MTGTHRLGIAGVLGVALSAASPAVALDLDIAGDTPVVFLGDTPTVTFTGSIAHPGPGIDGNVVFSGTLPPGFTVTGVDVMPGIVGGESTQNSVNSTRLLTFDSSGNRVGEVPITLQGVPMPSQPCGFYGMDLDPLTGEYFAFIGLQPPGFNDGGNLCYYASSIRDLFRIDPTTGVATWIASMPTKFNAMTIAPDGRIFAQASNGATSRSAIYQVNRDNGALTFIARAPIQSARVTWNAASNFAFNAGDGLIYTTAKDDIGGIGCMLGATDPNARATVFEDLPIDNGDCPDEDHYSMTYVGPNTFLVFDDSEDAYALYYDGSDWDWEWVLETDDSVRGHVGAGREQTLASGCTFNERTFSCTIPQIIPLGQYEVEVQGDFAATRTGTFRASFAANSDGGAESRNVDIRVVAADLAAFASVDRVRVDVGDTQVFTVEIENLGTRNTNATAIITPPSNVNYSTYSSTQGSCSWNGTFLNCNFGTVGPGMLARVTIETVAATDGAGSLVVEATSSNDESSLDNNVATARIVVGPAADLVVGAGLGAIAAAPAAQPGAAVPVTFTVANLGPDAAVDVVLRHRIPAGLDLDSAAADAGSCAVADGLLTCDLGDIAAGATVTVDLSPTPVSSGSFSLLVTAESASPPEINPANNQASLRLQVAPPSLSVELASGGVLGLTLTHGGETDQALAVRALTVRASMLGNVAGPLQVRVVRDDNGNGRADEGEQAVGNASLSLSGSDLRITLRSLTIESGDSVTLVFTQSAAATGVDTAAAGTSALAALGLIPVIGLLSLRRRRGALLALVLVSASILPGCGDILEELLRGRVQVTLTAVEAGLAGTQGDQSVVEGLPLEGPVTEVE